MKTPASQPRAQGPVDVLLIGFGNPARSDDGLGPALAHNLERHPIPGVAAMWDYQPGVEHAAEVADHAVVVFADASLDGRQPFAFRRLGERAMEGFSSHLLRPEHVLALARETFGWSGTAYLLAIRGEQFDAFDETLSPPAAERLRAAEAALREALAADRLDSLVTDPPTTCSDRSSLPCQTATPTPSP